MIQYVTRYLNRYKSIDKIYYKINILGFPRFINVDGFINPRAILLIQSITLGIVRTNICKQWKEIQEIVDKSDTVLEPNDIADAVMYALATRPEVQVRIIIHYISVLPMKGKSILCVAYF